MHFRIRIISFFFVSIYLLLLFIFFFSLIFFLTTIKLLKFYILCCRSALKNRTVEFKMYNEYCRNICICVFALKPSINEKGLCFSFPFTIFPHIKSIKLDLCNPSRYFKKILPLPASTLEN